MVIGLVGVTIISWPKLTLFGSPDGLAEGEALGVAAALTAAMIGALTLLLVRRLVRTEKSATIVLWFSLTSSAIGLFTLPFGWQPLAAGQAAFLIAAGICGGLAQILMTESYRHAEASTVAPFEYTSLIWAFILGYLIWHDVARPEVFAGAALIISAGLIIIGSEHFRRR